MNNDFTATVLGSARIGPNRELKKAVESYWAGKIDAEAERKKLADDLAYYEGFLASVMKKLSNERFVQSAPEKVVANERAKQADAEAKIAAIKAQLEALS